MENAVLCEDVWIEVIRNYVLDCSKNTDWLRPRLVCRFFNQQALYQFFLYRDHDDLYPWECDTYEFWEKDSYELYRRFCSWRLQAQFSRPLKIRSALLRSVQIISEAARLLFDSLSALEIDDLVPRYSSGFLGSMTVANSDPVLSRVAELVCDALVYHFGAEDTCKFERNPDNMFYLGRNSGPKNFLWKPIQVVFLAACYTGVLYPVRRVLEILDQAELDPTERDMIQVSGFHMAARRGHEHLIEFFLDNDIVKNDLQLEGPALLSAVESGKTSLVEFFVPSLPDDEYNPFWYDQALVAASQLYSPTTRMAVAKSIVPPGAILFPGTRRQVLQNACLFDDYDLVTWIIDQYPMTLYPKDDYPGHRGDHPLVIAAARGNIDITRLILEMDYEACDNHDDIVLWEALNHAMYAKTLNVFVFLLSRVPMRNNATKFTMAAQVEGALEAMERQLNPRDNDAHFDKECTS